MTADVIHRAIDGAQRHGAAIAAIAVRDTVKQAGEAGADGSRLIRATIPRDIGVSRPDAAGFSPRHPGAGAGRRQAVDATDEAMLVERLGLPVHVVEGDAKNIKITTPEDLERGALESDGFGRRR